MFPTSKWPRIGGILRRHLGPRARSSRERTPATKRGMDTALCTYLSLISILGHQNVNFLYMQMVLEVQGELESSNSTTEELTKTQRFASIYAA